VRSIVKSELIGTIIMSNYGKTAYYRVSDVKFIDLQTVIFDNSEICLLDYYKKKYNITITNLKQPLLCSEGKNKENEMLLIPELFLMTGIPENFDEQRRKRIS
jgi:hypothetical protein